ncbi:MAG: RNA methyltransferase [Pseudomonadota bacterium]
MTEERPRRPQAKKPAWVIEKERERRHGPSPVWLFGLHAVRDALLNPARLPERLVVTRNAADRLGEAIAAAAERSGMEVESADPRRFPAPLDPGSVHQGAALLTPPLDWGDAAERCAPSAERPAPIAVLLDRVTDPHNVGAILRSAEVFGAVAVIAPQRHAAPETGALAKAASGALERQPYLRVKNLGAEMERLRELGYRLIGLDGDAPATVAEAAEAGEGPLGLVLGAEGPGLRERTRSLCDALARIESAAGFGSLNVSNAAAVALYAARETRSPTEKHA